MEFLLYKDILRGLTEVGADNNSQMFLKFTLETTIICFVAIILIILISYFL